MDKNTWIGFLLIAAIIVGFTMLNRPSKEELAERQRVHDSIALVRMAEAEAQRIADSLQFVAGGEAAVVEPEVVVPEEKWVTLENEHLRLTLSTPEVPSSAPSCWNITRATIRLIRFACSAPTSHRLA